MWELWGLHLGRVYGGRDPSRLRVNKPRPCKRSVHGLPPVREYGPMRRILFGAIFLMVVGAPARAQKRLVLIDQDGSGPGGSNQMAMMVLLQSPQVEVLGITMVTGNAWRDEEVQHTLRMLELIGRTDVPVVPGAVFPLVRTEEETRMASQLYGKVVWLGAWGLGPMDLAQNKQGVIGTTANPNAHGPWEVPPMAEGAPHTKPWMRMPRTF